MNPAGLLLGLLAYNYRRHLLGRHTICSTTRLLLPRLLADAVVIAVFGWLLWHVHDGYRKETR